MRIDLSCPVESRGVTVKTNSTTNEPYALFRLFNLSEKVVSSVKFIACAYDAYGKELGTIPVEMTELDGQPKSPFAVNKGVSLADVAEAKHLIAEFSEVVFADGEVYTVDPASMTEINTIQPEYDEITRLKSVAGSDAVCYAQDPGPYWLCVCGRPNKQEDDVCVRCGREKQESLSKFSSHEKINKAIEEKRLADEAAEQARLEEEARQKALKKKKTQKTILTVIGAVVCVAILAGIVRLSYGFIATKIADGKVKKGDYIGAYELYRKVGSNHIGNASEQVKGNSFSNLIQSGILASDEENIYYLNSVFNIVKENRASGEKTTLGESQAVSLSSSGDWVYYMDPNSGELCRIKKDGSITETVTDQQFSFYTVVGNDLYYITQEEADVDATQQGAAQPVLALYHMNLSNKKSVKISNAGLYALDFYKGKIYYVDSDMENKLMVMDADGKNVQVLIDQPVYGFTILNDTIYYTNGNMPEGAQMPDMTLETADLSGKPIKTVVSDKKVSLPTATADGIFFTTYDDAELYRLNPETDEVTPAAISGFNVYNVVDGYFLYLNNNGELVKVKTDGSGEENLGRLNPSGGAAEEEVPAEEAPAEEATEE